MGTQVEGGCHYVFRAHDTLFDPGLTWIPPPRSAARTFDTN